MSDHTQAWAWLYWATTALLLLAPLYPAWKEWGRPQDDTAMALAAVPQRAARLTARHLKLTAQTAGASWMDATESIMAMPGSQFQKLSAPRIEFGALDAAAHRAAASLGGARCVVLKDLPHATPWGAGGWRVQGDCRIPASHHVTGSLVVTGDLSVEHDCRIDGSIKAHGDIRMAPRTVVTGAVVGDKNLWLDTACQVHGPVVCANHLSMGRAVTLGLAQHPTSVDAERITAHTGAVVHGAVWARQAGCAA